MDLFLFISEWKEILHLQLFRYSLRYLSQIDSTRIFTFIILSGFLIIMISHIYITVLAFRDKTIKGLLCLIIPGFNIAYAWVQKTRQTKFGLAGLGIGLTMTIIGLIFLSFVEKDLPVKGQQLPETMQPLQDRQVIAAYKERAWWLPYYPRLNALLDKSGGSLSTSYSVGPKGTSHVRIKIERGPTKSLILTLDFPPKANVSLYPNTGRTEHKKERSVWIYRDHDLDGMPDDCFSRSIQNPISEESFTDDGFMRVRDSTDHSTILAHWFIALADSTNHFFYGESSVAP